MKIIDFHTHPAYNTTKKFGYDLTDELFVDDLRRAGISMVAGSAIDLELMESSDNHGETIKKLNSTVWEWHKKHPDFIIPGIHIHPSFPEESANELYSYSKKGVKLVGELVNYLMDDKSENVSYISKNSMELYDLCSQLSLTVSIHTSTAEEMSYIAKNFKTLNIVMAHPAYGNEYLSRLEAVKNHDNLFLDISGTGIAAHGMLRYGVDTVGKEKIVFGTDFPGYNPALYVQSVLYEKLTDDEREHIFYKNAERLLGLK